MQKEAGISKGLMLVYGIYLLLYTYSYVKGYNDTANGGALTP